jgi:hypothetical protein
MIAPNHHATYPIVYGLKPKSQAFFRTGNLKGEKTSPCQSFLNTQAGAFAKGGNSDEQFCLKPRFQSTFIIL